MAKRGCIKSSDRISALPDELLVSILSLLSLKEAVATSILCRRWRYVWTFTSKLDFDGLDFFRKVWSPAEQSEIFDGIDRDKIRSVSRDVEESWNYIAWVDNVLRFHKGYSIEEFRVDFFLSESHREHIDRWLRFASDRNVETLDLNLWSILCLSFERYALPCQLLKNFKHLRTMRMQWVSVSGEGLESLLHSCPLLEELSVSYSRDLTSLKIIGPSLKLKRLTINYCRFLTSLEISDSNLVYLMFHGKPFRQLVLENIPQLVEMHVGGSVLKCLDDFVSMFSRHLPQLEKLTLNSSCNQFLNWKGARMFFSTVRMSKLRQLVIKLHVGRTLFSSLTTLICFVRASPLLQSLVIEAYGGEDKRRKSVYLVGRLFETETYKILYRYPHLKRLELIGFRGSGPEFGLVAHFLETGDALEEVNIDLRKRDNPWMFYSYLWPNSVSGVFHLGYPFSDEDENNAVKARTKGVLKKMVPSDRDVRVNIL